MRGRARSVVRERDTGREVYITDQGTAALIMDERARRLLAAPDLTPPEIRDFIQIRFRPGDGGPSSPGPRDYAADAEWNGIPPGEEINRAQHHYILGATIRTVRDHMFRVARAVKDWELCHLYGKAAS